MGSDKVENTCFNRYKQEKYETQKVVVSLTSYPARINIVHQVIESLFKQKEQVDEIVLWLSLKEFPGQYNDLPETLNCLIGKNGFRIEWIKENIKSHKKYFYALQNTKNIIITVDDDMYYSNNMVSTLMNSYRKHPRAISARSVRIITREKEKLAPYLTWEKDIMEYVGVERMDLCALGVRGVLYPPGCVKEEWFDVPAIMEFAENQDDLWLKFNEIIDHIPVVYTGKAEGDYVIDGSQDNSLQFQNVYGGDNDVSINKLIGVLKKNHELIYQQWFEGLMYREELLASKRKYYDIQLEDIIMRCNEQDIYICGAGKYAHILYEFIKSCEKENYIKAFLVTQNAQNENEIPIKLINDLGQQEEFCVICGVGKNYREEIKEALRLYEFHTWMDIDIPRIERLIQLEQNQKSVKKQKK